MQEGNTLVVTFVFALIVIYLVLAAQYESFRDPLIILIALPTSMFGALLPLNVSASRPRINIYTQIGLVTLIGLISKHGILMVELRQPPAGERGPGAARGDRARRRASGCGPILMTTAAMVVGMVPLHHRQRRRRAQPLRHRHRHRRRHDHRHAVHAVRDAGGLHLHRARPCARPRQGEGGGGSGGHLR